MTNPGSVEGHVRNYFLCLLKKKQTQKRKSLGRCQQIVPGQSKQWCRWITSGEIHVSHSCGCVLGTGHCPCPSLCPFSQNWGELSQCGGFDIYSYLQWRGITKIWQISVLSLKSMDWTVFTEGEGVSEYGVAFSVGIFQGEATVNTPARRKRLGCACVPCPQWNPFCSQM